MSDLRRFNKIKEDIENAQEKANKAEGALEQVMLSLKKDFKCNTLEEAQAKLKQMGKELEASKEEFDEALEDFETKWSDKL